MKTENFGGPIAEQLKLWQDEVLAPALEKHPDRKERFETASGIEFKHLYAPTDGSAESYEKKLGFPGQYPYTRGIQPTMYRGRLWTMRQYAGFASARETNERFRYLLSRGQTGLSVAFDLPTQMGYDSDHAMAYGEVGKTGVAIDTLKDMEILLEGIPLEKVSTSMTINATAAILLSLYIAVGEKQGVKPEQLRGTLQNDILKEYIARGTYIYPPEPSMRLITDVFRFGSQHLPQWNTISVSGYHIREAGSTAVQEIAFTLANGITYVRAALDAGLDVDVFASHISFFFNVHNDFLEEVSKFRAARRLWAKIMRERFGAKRQSSWLLRFHAQTGGSTLTAQQAENNIARVTIQGLAAVLGGTQSLHTNSMDEALGLPTEKAVTIALRTQQIIAHESGVDGTADPLGGAYCIEALTDELERRAEEYIEKIDAAGGVLRAIETGYIQSEIQESAYKWQRAVEERQTLVVGVNEYVDEDEVAPEILKIDPEAEQRQVAALKKIRTERDNDAVARARARLKEAAQGSDNLVPHILEAVRLYTSLGEISDTLREIFGAHRETIVV
ncbi:MAG: methylmalonyl-CoA mutase family protein [Nitrospinae bacterium]|nr:methylmalonyl-CoA mutase family protein [Nitrospinota bacterium]